MLTVDFANRHTHTLPHTVIKISTRICLGQLTRPLNTRRTPLLHCLPYLRTQSFGLDLRAWGANWQFLWNCTNTYEPVLHFFMANYTAAYEYVQLCVCLTYVCLCLCVCVCVSSCNKNVWKPALPEGFMIGFQPKPSRKGATKNEREVQKSNTQNK